MTATLLSRQPSPARREGSPLPEEATIRHRLAKLGYHEAFPREATSLVKRLLADLLVTTETCRTLKGETEKWGSDATHIEGQIPPLRSEISRLTAENNHLHRDLVRLADERDARERRAAQSTRRLESQTADLRFVASQYAHRVESEQKKVEQARRKAEEALAKMGLFEKSVSDAKLKAKAKGKDAPGQADVAARAEKLFQRLQKIDIETGLEPQQPTGAVHPPPEPVTVDVVALAESRVAELQKKNDVLVAKNMELETEVDLAHKQLDNREQEIKRLGSQLEIARAQQFTTIPFDNLPDNGNKVQKIHDLDVARKRIEQLEVQLHHMQEHTESLEKEISTHDEEKQTLYKAMSTEKRDMADELQRERQRAKDLAQSMATLERMVGQYNDLKEHSIRSDARRRRGSISPSKLNESQGLKSEPPLPSQNPPRMSHQPGEQNEAAALRAQIDKLQQENARLASSGGASARKSQDESCDLSSQLEALRQTIRTLEEESRAQKARLIETEAQKWAMENDLMGLRREVDKTKQREAELAAFRTRAQTLQRDLSLQQAEFNRVSSLLEATSTKTNETEAQKAQLTAELENVQRERDDLILALQKFEDQLAEVQNCVEIVTADRDNIAGMYEQVNEELQSLRQSISSPSEPATQLPPPRSTAPPEPSAPTLSPDGRAPSRLASLPECQYARRRMEELEEEVIKLQRDLEATVLRERQARETANESVYQMEQECDRLRHALSEKEKQLNDTVDQAQAAERIGERAHAAKSEFEKREETLRQKLGDIEINRDREAYQLRDLRGKLADTESLLARANGECDRLRKETEIQAKQVYEQKQLLIEVDQQRDRDRDEMDRQCEKVVGLEGVITVLQKTVLQGEQEVGSLRDQLDLVNHHLNERDVEVGSLRTKIESLVQDRDRWADEARQLGEETRNVGADLAALSKENQLINSELADIGQERDRLKDELVESERQIQQLDELLLAKDQERDHLFAAYRKLAGEHERLDLGVKVAGEESSSMRMEMLMKDKRVAQLQQELNETAAELTKYKIDAGALEKQCSNLSRSLASAQRTAKHLDADKQRLARDVAAARDLAHSLDRQKDDFQKRLTSATLELERTHALVSKLETDREALAAQTQAERTKADRLEHIVALERTRKIQTELAAKDLQDSKGTLEEQLQRVNQQQALSLASMTSELDTLKKDAIALREKVDALESTLADKMNSKP
ncbi:hypothetical protein DFJ77DRAFT_190419 [Powellomyces hirtus]|nr:hypothetical protein DFJ77DRAFT_190419 [Powellomyces hirtus]